MDFTLLFIYFITVNKYRFCISVIGYINMQLIGIGYNKSVSVDHYSKWQYIREVRRSTFVVVEVTASGEFSLWVWRRLQHGHTVLVYDLQLEFGFGASPPRGCIGETLELRQTRLCETNTVLGVRPRQLWGAETQRNRIRQKMNRLTLKSHIALACENVLLHKE